jgi:hypothetical protein
MRKWRCELKIKSVLFFLMLAPPIMAQTVSQQPYAIKQDVLGESLAQYQANNPKDCPASAFKTNKDRGAVFCTVAVPATYAGQTLTKKTVGFIHDRLYYIEMTLAHTNYVSVTAALAEKFGKPEERFTNRSVYLSIAETLSGKEKTHEERLNVPEIGVTQTWKNGVSEISASEYDLQDTNFQTSSLLFTLDVLAKEAVENMDKAIKALNAKSKTDM